MTKDDTDIVSAVRAALAGMVGKDRFELWFGSSTRLSLADDTLWVCVPNRFYQDFIRTNFRRQLEASALATLGHAPVIQFRIEPAPAEPADAATPRRVELVAAPSVATNPSPREEAEAPARRAFGDLASFVSGESNRLAFTSADMAARQPGQITPLLIVGPTGVGKTHLLQGVWTSARKARRLSRVMYLSAEQFTSGFLEALRGSGLPSFRRKYRGMELFLLDDVQFLAGKRATQVELLHTVDDLLREGRQLVFSADRLPSAIGELSPELAARLECGMVCRIDPPDYATRLGILGQMARRFGLNLPQDVQEYVATNLTSHARELSGALCRLEATSRAFEMPITLELAQEALSELVRHGSRVVRLTDIEKAVCDVFGVDSANLQSESKSKRVSNPRMLAMWLARKHTRAALSEIGDYFGRRSHSTVISAQKRVEHWLAAGEPIELAQQTWKLADAIRQVEKRLQAC